MENKKKKFGRNSGFKLVSAETEIRECLERNYLNFRAFILPLLTGDRAVFEKTEKRCNKISAEIQVSNLFRAKPKLESVSAKII